MYPSFFSGLFHSVNYFCRSVVTKAPSKQLTPFHCQVMFPLHGYNSSHNCPARRARSHHVSHHKLLLQAFRCSSLGMGSVFYLFVGKHGGVEMAGLHLSCTLNAQMVNSCPSCTVLLDILLLTAVGSWVPSVSLGALAGLLVLILLRVNHPYGDILCIIMTNSR